jgi:hypothetical protein
LFNYTNLEVRRGFARNPKVVNPLYYRLCVFRQSAPGASQGYMKLKVEARLQYAAILDHIPIGGETKGRWVVCEFDNSIIDTSEATGELAGSDQVLRSQNIGKVTLRMYQQHCPHC